MPRFPGNTEVNHLPGEGLPLPLPRPLGLLPLSLLPLELGSPGYMVGGEGVRQAMCCLLKERPFFSTISTWTIF